MKVSAAVSMRSSLVGGVGLWGAARRAAMVVAAVLLGGCGSLVSHNTKVDAVIAIQRSGDLAEALTKLDGNLMSSSDMLLNLERGALLRSAGRYDESLRALQLADEVVQGWEDGYRKRAEKYLENTLAVLSTDRVRSYEGQDYEKVMLTTLMALDRIAVGDWETARVDIRRTHEREDLIAEVREKELDALKEKAKNDGVGTGSTQELGGYPVEIFDDPAVRELRNGYQNALSHYLAGFIYEALGEGGLAAPGYRKALEIRPEHPVLRESLRGLDHRLAAAGSSRGGTDVLVVIEAGVVPKRVAQPVVMPIFYRRSRMPVNFALPRIVPSSDKALHTLTIGGKSYPLRPVVDFGAMARRSLKDEMPGMMLRSALRLAVQGAFTEAASRAANVSMQRNPNDSKTLMVGVAAELTKLAFVATQQQIDDRMWRLLPERIYLARLRLPPGEHEVLIDGRPLPRKVSVGGRHALLPVRVDANHSWVGTLASRGELAFENAQLELAPVGEGSQREAASVEALPAVAPKAAPSKSDATPGSSRSTGKRRKPAGAPQGVGASRL